MSLKIGEINQLEVLRKTDIGYMLVDMDQEVFLHNNETNFLSLQAGQIVDAFLYFDQKGRLAATLTTPILTASRPQFLKVTDVVAQLGVFLDMGISKELLLSIDDLPTNTKQWPQIGDMIYSSLKIKGKFVCRIPNKDEIALKPENELELKSSIDAYVYKIGREGYNLLTLEGHQVFVHQSQVSQLYRLGEKVSVKIIFHSEKGYSGSLVIQKEKQMFDDAQIILSYLIRNEVLPLTAKSSTEDIEKYFFMSKKAFKRAIGLLYKERKIDFTEEETVLVKKG